jgi:uncharacterized membrane protein YccF (DUF307 family)
MSEFAAPKKLKVQPTREVPFLLRVLWFFVFGLELTGAWILIAWFLNLTIIGLPLGLWMIDRVPQVLTLKSRGGAYVYDSGQRIQFIKRTQPNVLLRLLYFVLVGWWLSFFWALAGYILCATIVGLPLGALMLNTLPQVTTLHLS